MITQQRSLLFVSLLLDFFIIAGVFLIAALLAQPTTVLLTHKSMFFLPFILFIVWYFSTGSTGYYANIGSRFYVGHAFNLLKVVVYQSITIILFVFLVKETFFTRNFLILYGLILYTTSILKAIALRKILKYRKRSGKKLRNLLIIGGGDTALDFLSTVKQNPALGYSYIGIISSKIMELPEYIGTFQEIESIISDKSIDEVFISLEQEEESSLRSIISLCNKYAVHTYIIPNYLKLLSAKYSISTVDKFPVLTLRQEPLEEIHWRILKRTFDILIAVAVCITIVPWLFPIIFLFQKVFSPGPVFYLQDRVGKNNNTFKCFKFRSMSIDKSDKLYQPTEQNDSRITSFGKFLRKSNLDELPQIFNVLLGDMSIVGPRPHAVIYDEVYKEFIEELRLRNLVKPGITGWAQVHGLRGDIVDMEENKKRIKKRIEYDIWYIENWSVNLDIQIMFITFWQMIKGDTKGF